jgi:type II secretory pathway predicted ATPase ExeA
MYEAHFGMQRRPFRPVPDSECYYAASNSEQALAQLLQAVGDDEGLMLVTGEAGTGKTLLCQCLLGRLGEGITSVLVTNSHLPDRASLFQCILFDLGQPHAQRNEQELRLALTEYLLANYTAGRRTLFIIDEAHHLTPDLLEELRLLGNLEGRQGKAVQILLLGQPALLETLSQPELSSLRQRLAVRVQLEPLPVHEAGDYLVWHLRAVGARPDQVISDEAFELLAQHTRGVPRLLNQAAHAALTLAHQGGVDQVDAEVALEALAALGLQPSQETEPISLSTFAPGPHPTLDAPSDDEGAMSLAVTSTEETATNATPVHRLFPPARQHGRHISPGARELVRPPHGLVPRNEE